MRYKVSANNVIAICLFVYFTSKLLWDYLIPGVFEILSLVCILLFAVSYIYKYCRHIGNDQIKLFAIYAMFVVYIILNAFVKDSKEQFTRAMYEYIFYSLIFWAMSYALMKTDFELICKVITKLGLLTATLSWYEYFTNRYLIGQAAASYTEGIGGAYGFRTMVFSRSYLPHGMVLGFFAMIYFYLYLKNKKISSLIGCAYCYITILSTSSRGPLAANGIALFLMYILYSYYEQKSIKKILSYIIIALGALVAYLILTSNIRSDNEMINYFLIRIRSIIDWHHEGANITRTIIWNNSIENYFKQAPVFGIGASKTGSWSYPNMHEPYSIGVTESGMLKKLCELGIVGVVLYYGFIISIIAKGIKSFKVISQKSKVELIGYFGFLIAVLINDITLQTTEEIMVSFQMWAALAGIYVTSNKVECQKVRWLFS